MLSGDAQLGCSLGRLARELLQRQGSRAAGSCTHPGGRVGSQSQTSCPRGEHFSILGDAGPSIDLVRKMLFKREAGASWPLTGLSGPPQLSGKESGMLSTSTLLESQDSCTKRATAPAVPPLPALHVSKRCRRSPQLLPEHPAPLGWAGTALPAKLPNSQNR